MPENGLPPKAFVVSVDLHVPSSGRRGRAFFSSRLLRSLAAELERRFLDEDDESRLQLLMAALARPEVTIEVYPGEATPVEMHAYLRARGTSDAPVFACVLASPPVVEHLAAMPPNVVLETATFQAIDDAASAASLIAGLEAWARRVFPEIHVPRFRLEQWPNIEGLAPFGFGFRPAWRMHLSAKPMIGARATLVANDYARPEELRNP